MLLKRVLKVLPFRSGSVRKLSAAALVVGGCLAATDPAMAGFQFFDARNTSTGINSNSQSYIGVYERNSNNTQPIPFTIQVYSSGNECVRLAVTQQPSDLEIVLIAPDGTRWRDDDGGGSNRPLVKANTTVNGWYTVHISQFAGGTGAGNFTLRYGRYNSGNPNCATPSAAF